MNYLETLIPDHSDLSIDSAVQLADAMQATVNEIRVIEDSMDEDPTGYRSVNELHVSLIVVWVEGINAIYYV